MAEENTSQGGRDRSPELDDLKDQAQDLLRAVAEKGLNSVAERAGDLTDRLTEYAGNGGGPGLQAALTGGKSLAKGESPLKGALSGAFSSVKDKTMQALGGGGSGGGGSTKMKFMNIVEQIEVGVPVRVAYNQWTQFGDWTGFMKKLENADQESDEKVSMKGQVFWSHRTWDSTITEQISDDHIVWRSTGEKGHVDGSVTFHEIAPRLTRILVILEYYPQGLFEKTGNLWRAQGRRARLELKHFQRHVMTSTILEPDEVEGWRGEIRDSEVVKSHEDALQEEEEDSDQEPPGGETEDDMGEEERGEDEAAEPEEPEDEQDGDEEEAEEPERAGSARRR